MKSPVLFIMLFLTTACGYHLRGTIALPEALNKLFISNASASLNNAFINVYKDKLVKNKADAELIIKILSENSSRHTLSTDTSGFSNEYALIYQLSFNLIDQSGKILSANQSIKLNKTYFNTQSGSTLLAKSTEEASLRKEMYQDAVFAITNKIRATLTQ